MTFAITTVPKRMEASLIARIKSSSGYTAILFAVPPNIMGTNHYYYFFI